MKRVLISLGFLCCLMIGCQEGDRVLIEYSGEVEKDTQAIRDIVADYNASMDSSDINRIMLHYADDAIRIPPNESAVIGIEKIRNHIQQLFDEYTLQEKNTVENIIVSGDLAIAHVLWSATISPKIGGDPLDYNGNWIAAFERQSDGSWKINYSIFSNEQLVYPEQ